MCTINPKTITKIAKQRDIANKSRKEIKQNHKKYSMQKKAEKGGTKNRRDKQETNGKMMDLNPATSIIMLNVHTINSPLKKWRLSHCILKK